MVNQDEWDDHLDSVLFSIRVHKHSSTGMTPFRMMFNRDPILPFQYKDRLEQNPDANPEDCFNLGEDVNQEDCFNIPVEGKPQDEEFLNVPFPESRNSIDEMVAELEKQCLSIYSQADINIKKAQKVQERNYNKRKAINSKNPIKPGDLVMKINLGQKNRKAKMKNAHLGPYSVVSVTEKGFYLRDKYSHALKRPVPGVQLVRYYGHMPIPDSLFTNTSKYQSHPECDSLISESVESYSEMPEKTRSSCSGSEADISSESDKDIKLQMSSVRCRGRLSRKRKTKNLLLDQKQLIISRGSDQTVSSDESINIQVCDIPLKKMVQMSDIGHEYDLDNLVVPPENTKYFHNPFGEANVDEIPIDIGYDDITNCNNPLNENVQEKCRQPPNIEEINTPVTIFKPLLETELIEAGNKLNIRIERSYTRPKFTGIGKEFINDPAVTISAKGNGQCLPNCFSLILSGCDMYAFLIRHALCNFIEDPDNFSSLRQHIPMNYKSGHEYITKTGRRRQTSWCTEVEIFAFALLTGFDVLVYSIQKKWLMYTKSSCGTRSTERAFYINNISGYHFDPVFTTDDYL